MQAVRICSECGQPLAGDTSEVLCPMCALRSVADGESEWEASPAGDWSGAGKSDHDIKDGQSYSPPPRAFADYELLEEIARGGMGVVYRARQKSLNRVVALKMIAGGALASAAALQRFRAEAQAAASLQHPNIVAIHEVGEHEGQPFFTMDYVEGRNLADLLRDGPLPPRRAASYARTIAEAVQYAHQRGILHRDLKPSNVLIDAHDQPRITDFGLAKQMTGESDLTVSGQVLGSPNFMAPEQAQGRHREVGPPSDVYSIGALLYHLLSGRPVFQAATLTEVLRLVVTSEPPAPRLLNPSIPRDLETICLKCLEKEIPRRYRVAQALVDELDRFLRGEPILARSVGPAGKVGKWCRRNPRLALAIGAVVLSFLIGLAGATWQWRRAEAEALLARRNAYAADMKEVQRALEESELSRARDLLVRHRPVGESAIDLRGWEWRYLWARCQSEERSILCWYSNPVSALAFSPDGKLLAVGLGKETVALWETAAKRQVTELRGAGEYKTLAFSPTGNLLAWGNEDASKRPVVSLWDLNMRKETAQFPLSSHLVAVTFSPDAKVMGTLAYDGIVSLWEVESRRVVTNFATPTFDILAERFSAAAEEARPGVTRSSIDHYGCVLFSPDGRWLAVGEARPRIRLLDCTTLKEKEPITLPPSADGIAALAFSPDSKLLAAGCGAADNDVHVWDLAAQTEVRFTGHSGWIAALAFSPDGETLASVSADQTVRLWDVARQVERRRFQGNTDEVWAVAWSRDGKDLVTGGKDGSVRYWDPAAPRAAPYGILPERISFWGPAFLPDSGTFLAVDPDDGVVVQWHAATARKLGRLSFLGANHFNLDLSGDGRWLALSDAVGNIRVWDFKARQLVTNLVAPARVFALTFSPRGNILVGGAMFAEGRTIPKLWAVAGWRELSLQGIGLKRLVEFTLSPDERTLAIGYEDGTAAWWDLPTGQRHAVFDCHYASGVRVRFSPDGKLFATAGLNGLITVWDVATRQSRPIARGFRNALHDVVFSPDSRRLIAAGTSPNGLVKVWDVETGRDVAALPGEPGRYAHIGFSPDGNTLFATSLQGTSLLWRAPSWQEIEAMEKQQRVP